MSLSDVLRAAIGQRTITRPPGEPPRELPRHAPDPHELRQLANMIGLDYHDEAIVRDRYEREEQ